MSLADLRRRLAVPRRRHDRIRRHAARGGARRHRAQRPPPALRARRRAAPAGPLWKRALSSQIVLDESTALALSQPTPELGGLAFYACGCSLFVALEPRHADRRARGRSHRRPLRARPRRRLPGQHARAARAAAAPARHARGRARRRRARARGHALHGARRARSCWPPPARSRRASYARSRHDLVGRLRAGGGHLRAQGGRTARARLAHRAAAAQRALTLRLGHAARRPWSPSARSATAAGLALDARAAGLAVALGAVWLRAPFAVVVIAATATAAGLRALGVG